MDNRRRIYFINAGYQGRFIFAFIFSSAAGIAAAAWAILFYLREGFEQNLYRSHYNISQVSDIVLPITVKVNLLFSVMGALAVGLLSYYYFRRAANLSDRIMKAFSRLRQGYLNFAVEIGQKRDFPDLERFFEIMVAANRARMKEVKRQVRELEEMASGLCAAAEEGRDIKPMAARAAIKAAELEAALGCFQTERSVKTSS